MITNIKKRNDTQYSLLLLMAMLFLLSSTLMAEDSTDWIWYEANEREPASRTFFADAKPSFAILHGNNGMDSHTFAQLGYFCNSQMSSIYISLSSAFNTRPAPRNRAPSSREGTGDKVAISTLFIGNQFPDEYHGNWLNWNSYMSLAESDHQELLFLDEDQMIPFLRHIFNASMLFLLIELDGYENPTTYPIYLNNSQDAITGATHLCLAR